MRYKTLLTTFLLATTQISLLVIFNVGVSRSEEVWKTVDIELQSLKRIDECLQKEELLQKLVESQGKTISELEKSLATAKKERDLEKRENELNLKIIEIKDKEIVSLNDSFNRMKDVSDRAIKLAETKKSNVWETWGPLGIIAIIVVTIASSL